MAVSNVVPEEQVEQSALTDFISSDTGPIEGIQEIFSNILVCSSLLMNTSIMVVKIGSVVV